MIYNEIGIIFILLLINAFFALSELAIVSSSKPLLRQMERRGNKRAKIALELAENSGRFLSTVQVGITLVGTLAGAYGGATIAEKLEEPFNAIDWINPHGEMVAVVLVVTVITYFSVVIGELIPKQIALSNPEKAALIVAKPMALLSRTCSPIVWLLESSSDSVMRLLGVLKKETLLTENEVRAVLEEGVASGAIEKEEHEMLRRIIRLDQRDVKSIMTHRVDVTFIDINDDIEAIRRKVHESGHSRYPVIRGDHNKVIGVVLAKKLLEGALSPKPLVIKDHVQDAIIIPETTTCLKAIDIFKATHIHFAVIVDEYGATEGIITASDLLEAIIGVLPSNYAACDGSPIVRREDGSWLVDGTTSIDEVRLSIGLEEIQPDHNFDTLAGFVIHHLRKTPVTGDKIFMYNHSFEVVDMDNRRIDKVLITDLMPVRVDEE